MRDHFADTLSISIVISASLFSGQCHTLETECKGIEDVARYMAETSNSLQFFELLMETIANTSKVEERYVGLLCLNSCVCVLADVIELHAERVFNILFNSIQFHSIFEVVLSVFHVLINKVPSCIFPFVDQSNHHY